MYSSFLHCDPPLIGLAGASRQCNHPTVRNRSYSGQQGSPAAPPRESKKTRSTFFFQQRGPLLLSSQSPTVNRVFSFAGASPPLPSFPFQVLLSIVPPQIVFHHRSCFRPGWKDLYSYPPPSITTGEIQPNYLCESHSDWLGLLSHDDII